MPSHLISAWNCLALYCEPQSCRRPRPRAMALPKPPMWARTPWRTGSSAAQRSALLRHVPADDVRSVVIDGREEPAPALCLRPEPRRVRSPEFVEPLGADPAAVAPVSAGMPPPHRRQQPVRPQPEHPVLASPDPLGRKSRLDLPVALAQERACLQHRPDLLRQLLVAQRRLRAALPGCRPDRTRHATRRGAPTPRTMGYKDLGGSRRTYTSSALPWVVRKEVAP